MDHLIDDNDRLKPCPFCGGEATFDHDDNGWNWIECLACGASTNARVSAMDDCKPLLLEQWNKRVPSAPSGLHPLETVRFWADAYTHPGDDNFRGHGMAAALLREYAELRAALAAAPEAKQ